MRLKSTLIAALAVCAFAALPTAALASYRVSGTQYGIPTVASNNISAPFARKVERVGVRAGRSSAEGAEHGQTGCSSSLSEPQSAAGSAVNQRDQRATGNPAGRNGKEGGNAETLTTHMRYRCIGSTGQCFGGKDV